MIRSHQPTEVIEVATNKQMETYAAAFKAQRTPKPARRNPFKRGSMLALQFDSILEAYSAGHRDVIRDGVRCMGNGWAVPFWRGYDGVTPGVMVPTGTLAWACYRAGQSQRIEDNKLGIYVPPKTNSIVKATGSAS